MPYATAEDIAALYGQITLDAVAARGDDGEPDTDAIDSALETAGSEIDSYLAARYATPLDPAPPYIKKICIDMAIYSLALDDAPRTLEMRLRYEDAIKYLTTVSKGLANIDTGAGGTGEGGEPIGDVGSKATIRTVVRG